MGPYSILFLAAIPMLGFWATDIPVIDKIKLTVVAVLGLTVMALGIRLVFTQINRGFTKESEEVMRHDPLTGKVEHDLPLSGNYLVDRGLQGQRTPKEAMEGSYVR